MSMLISLCFVSMILFCLAMEKHRKQILSPEFIHFQLPNIMVMSLKPLAWLILLIALNFSIDLYGWSIGPAIFFGVLSGCLLPLILLLTYRANVIIFVFILLSIMSFINY